MTGLGGCSVAMPTAPPHKAGAFGGAFMADSLKLGIAGLGTVGTALLDVIAERGEAMAARIGRRLEVVAVSARDARQGPRPARSVALPLVR
jgi:hypothetical protein